MKKRNTAVVEIDTLRATVRSLRVALIAMTTNPTSIGGWCIYCQANLLAVEPHRHNCRWQMARNALEKAEGVA